MPRHNEQGKGNAAAAAHVAASNEAIDAAKEAASAAVHSLDAGSPVAHLHPISVPIHRSTSNSTPATTPRPAAGFSDLRTDAGSSAAYSSMMSGAPTALDQERIQNDIEHQLLAKERAAIDARSEAAAAAAAAAAIALSESKGASTAPPPAPAFELREVLPFFQRGMDVIVQDGFSRCFESSRSQPWNWNLYLWPLWACGVFIRYCILFPLRAVSLLLGLLVTLLTLTLLNVLPLPTARRQSLQRKLIRFLCSVFVFSWTGVIKYHGRLPQNKPGRIYVANHTSMIDMIILSQMHTFSVVGQKHPGWIGWMQTHVLNVVGTVWFDRNEADDRVKSAQKMKDHIFSDKTNRLLIFPEGTCVNNLYCVQFKQGVFDMGAEVCPIAIKYNKIFVDAFWNSKAQSFQAHLATLMCSWALVCDVWYLEPQRIRPGESGIEFSNRVKKMIADKAGLKNVPYDGYLKHFEVKASLIEKQQRMYAEAVLSKLTPTERAQIEEEEERERQVTQAAQEAAADALAMATTSPNGATPLAAAAAAAVPSSLTATAPTALSTSSRKSSDSTVGAGSETGGRPRGDSLRSPSHGLGALAAVSSSANLIQLLNAKQEEERKAEEQQLRQRKVPDAVAEETR